MLSLITDVAWEKVKWPYVTATLTACSLKKLMATLVNVRQDTLEMAAMATALITV